MNPNHKAYTVCFLFTDDLQLVLLQQKAKTDFAGLLNGVGGKLEPGETPEQCAIREIKEETGIGKLKKLTWLGTLNLPYNCDTHAESYNTDDPACILHFFGAILPETWDYGTTDTIEPLRLVSVNSILNNHQTLPLAGDGDMQYFIRQALTKFRKD